MSSSKVYWLERQGSLLFSRAAVGRRESNPLLVRLLVDTGAPVSSYQLGLLGMDFLGEIKAYVEVALPLKENKKEAIEGMNGFIWRFLVMLSRLIWCGLRRSRKSL